MATLPQLVNPQSYRACEWDLKADAEQRRYWVGLFLEHADYVMGRIATEYPDLPAERIKAFEADYKAEIAALDESPEQYEQIDILTMTKLRHRVQTKHGIGDPYASIKRLENDRALQLLPAWLRELDALPEDARPLRLAQGVLAGNIFDLGAPAAIERYESGQGGFETTLAGLPQRPWLVDGFDAWQQRLRAGRPHVHAGFFVDNSGADITLGCIPMARALAATGTQVTLLANSEPALNDVTAPELAPLLRHAAESDPLLGELVGAGKIDVMATGTGEPLVDVTCLSDECVAHVADCDLIMIHGMGRAVESNFTAKFKCDTLRTAVIKDEAVARLAGGKLFDCVFRFERA